VRKELLWSGELSGRAVSLFYNKFPLLDRHALLVPDPDDCRPQYLERRDHCFVWDLLESSAGSLEGLGFGFNSYGAFASVNHLHAQTFVRTRPLPITHARWIHNGGPDAYPLDCRRFGAPGEAWDFVAHLHRREKPCLMASRAATCRASPAMGSDHE